MNNYFLLYLISQYWYARCECFESVDDEDKEYHDVKWGESHAFEMAISELTNIWAGDIFNLWASFYDDNHDSKGFADAIIALAK